MRTAIRRHNDERILKRRMSLPRYQWARGNQKWMGIYRNTGSKCSCLFCRPHRYSGASVQERRQIAWMDS